MEPVNTELSWIERRLRRRRDSYAAIAIVGSLIIHAFLIYRFPSLSFGTVAQAIRQRQSPATRVERIERGAESLDFSRPERLRPEAPDTQPGLPGEAGAARAAPAESLFEPRILPAEARAGETTAKAAPVQPGPRADMDPHLDILRMSHPSIPDAASALPRTFVADITRTSRAADFVPPADRGSALPLPPGARDDFARPGSPSGTLDAVSAPGPRVGRPGRPPRPADNIERQPPEALRETAESVTGARPLERLLRVDVRTYSTIRDLAHVYVEIGISRESDGIPAIPKDIVFVQDCSASMTEQRLHFCRDGLARALASVQPGDRFNVLGFRETVEPCFPGWATNSAGAIAAAAQFISGLKSSGNTDIYRSLGELLRMPRTPGRPLIAVVVSDGVPTVGLTSSPRIIGEFSRESDGAISIFTLGTARTANGYLLDLLSRLNRGDSEVITRGRWELPEAIAGRAAEVARPVLTDLRFGFPRSVPCEVYPALPANLYLDRPLVLYGRIPRGQKRLVFHAAGRAGDRAGDMLFDVDLAAAPEAGEDLRERWAWQKVYYLYGQYIRTRDDRIRDELDAVARAFGVHPPYPIAGP